MRFSHCLISGGYFYFTSSVEELPGKFSESTADLYWCKHYVFKGWSVQALSLINSIKKEPSIKFQLTVPISNAPMRYFTHCTWDKSNYPFC